MGFGSGIAGLCACCFGIIMLLVQLAVFACAVASPVLATVHMVNQQSGFAEILKWHAGLGYAYLLFYMIYGCTNRGTTSAIKGFRSGEVEDRQQMSTFGKIKEFVISLLVIGITIGFMYTSFRLFFNTSNNEREHLIYTSALCGIGATIATLIIVPLTLICAFSACCAGFSYAAVSSSA